MLVREWMTEKVITVTQDSSMLKASKLLKDNNIRRLPVVDKANKVIGIISYSDIKDASPSKATTLDIHELHYLLSEIQVKDVMTPEPLTILLTDTLEKAVLIMEEQGFGSLPVVDDNDTLCGIITDHDLFKVYVEVTGARRDGLQIALKIKEGSGTLLPFLEFIHSYNARLLTVLSTDCIEDGTYRKVYVHLRPMEKEVESKLIAEIKEKFTLLYWVSDKVYEV